MDFSNIDRLWTWITPTTSLLFVVACGGYTALQVYWLNRFLGWPWPRWFSRIVRKLNTVAVFGGPVLIGAAFVLAQEPSFKPSVLTIVLGIFLWFCWGCGFFAVPVLQIHYWLNRRGSALQSNHSEVIDIAKQLGYKPYGRGRHSELAYLPGNQIFQVEFAERHLRIPDLPQAWEGLTILHITDLHFRGTPDKAFFAPIMERCNEWNPDLVAITGDIVDSNKHHRWIVPLLGRLRWQIGAFAILGNHDYWFDPLLVRRRLRKLHMHVLGNSWHHVDVRGEPLVLIGHEGPWFQPGPDLSDCPDGFRLCLSHTPDNMAWAKKQSVKLMLSGHTHGGQIRFPLIGSVYVPALTGRRYDCGTFQEGSTVLHVSRGVAGQHPVRYNCRPEVTLLVLHRASAS